MGHLSGGLASGRPLGPRPGGHGPRRRGPDPAAVPARPGAGPLGILRGGAGASAPGGGGPADRPAPLPGAGRAAVDGAGAPGGGGLHARAGPLPPAVAGGGRGVLGAPDRAGRHGSGRPGALAGVRPAGVADSPAAPRPAARPAGAGGGPVRVPLHRHPGLGHGRGPDQRGRHGGLALVPLRPADRCAHRGPRPAAGRRGLRPRDRPHRASAPALFRLLLPGEPRRHGAGRRGDRRLAGDLAGVPRRGAARRRSRSRRWSRS